MELNRSTSMEIPFLESEPRSSSSENVSTSSIMETRSDEDSTCHVFAFDEAKKQLDLLQKFIDFDMEQLKKVTNDPIPSNPAKFRAYMKNFGKRIERVQMDIHCVYTDLSMFNQMQNEVMNAMLEQRDMMKKKVEKIVKRYSNKP